MMTFFHCVLPNPSCPPCLRRKTSPVSARTSFLSMLTSRHPTSNRPTRKSWRKSKGGKRAARGHLWTLQDVRIIIPYFGQIATRSLYVEGAGPQRMKQRRNRIKRRTATPVAAIDKQDNLAMADSGEGPSSSSTEGSRKPSTSAPMELPDIQPFALRNVPPTTTANPDALQKDPWYKKGWFRRRTASDPPTSQAKIAENSELHFNRYYRIGELNGTKVMMRIRPTFASNRMDFGFKIKIIDEESSAPSDSAQQRA
ncbi:hypothetical protein RvY_12570-1 [Ramazzottius varieornatus]|uniref:Uncharacterized protein n=1 Tax=Ramazzottius varieornatus TaxID=947166 RepID=A0A1D1VTN9_RAMVA|nr:hypothetical protein RvY_12570-1 [Ramazzottius varieornatus]